VGYKLLQRLAGDVQELGFIETSAKQDGRNMTMVMAPHRVVKELAAKSRPVRKLKDDEDAMAADAADRDAANPDGAQGVVVVDQNAPIEAAPATAAELTATAE
jgi:translation initiation factor IF-3